MLFEIIKIRATVILTLLSSSLIGRGDSQCFSKNDRVSMPTSAEFSSVTDFALDVHKELFPFNASGNYVVSPHALWKSLALAYFGSSGNTQVQLEDVLGATDKISTLKIWSYLNRLYQSERNNTSGMLVDAKVYVEERRSLRPCVEEIIGDALMTQNFSNVYKSTVEINNWIASSTGGQVRTLYQPEDLEGVNMLIASTGIHKGSWLYPFKKSASRSQPFYPGHDDYVDVTTMTQKGYFNYGESAELGAQVLELPYAGRTVSMYILLPPLNSGAVGIINTMKSLNPATLSRALAEMQHAEIRVVLPKFKFQYETDLELKKALSRMGAKDLFNKEEADLTIFSPTGNLSVGHITHKAFIAVDEGGVDAASAKTLDTSSYQASGPLKQRVFVCNRPFLFLLMDKLASRILFIGAYRDPRE
ncbi:serine protease inhibitor 88Ea-like [Palaemon carinicauda]|uniref:serine protease inhibitor 88Ea-like n=1 Tax=Palaemon carinicauda TaxID=392227 RepID=UPI0035B5AC51